MAGPTADAKLKIGVDDRQARASIKRLQGDLGGASGAVKTSQERIEKLATAVTGTSSVLGGMGAKAGAAAGAVSNLAAAFLTGGPLLLGMAAATTAAAVLWNEYNKADEAAKALAKANKDILAKSLADVKAGAEQAETALLNFGKSSTQVALDSARAGLSGAQTRVAGKSRADRARRMAMELAGFASGVTPEEAEKFLTSSTGAGAAQFGEMGQAFLALQQNYKAVSVDAASAAQEVEGFNRQIAAYSALLDREASKRGKGKKGGGKSAKLGFRIVGETLDPTLGDAREFAAGEADVDRKVFERQMAADVAAQKAAAEQQKREAEQLSKDLIALKKKEEAEKLRAAKAAIEAEKQARRAMAEEVAGFSIGLLTMAMEASLTVMEAGLRNQKIEWDKFVGSIIRGIGSQIFGIGTKYAIEGAGMIAMSKGTDPAGWATAAVGAGGMALGAGMMASGTVIGSIGDMQKAASSGDGGSGAAVSTRRGGRTGSSGDGDGENITLNFFGGTHLGDPTERARTMARDQRRAGREVVLPGRP